MTIDNIFDLIELSDATAEVLFDKIIHSFKKNNTEFEKNMIGFASDGANVMMGNNNSVMSRLRTLIPDLFIFKCICHSFHLCASTACEKLPVYIEVIVRDIHNYLNTSPKRTKAFMEFQKFLELKPLKMLHPAQTRWLSLLPVVTKVIDHYNALKLFFQDQVFSEKTELNHSRQILDKLDDPITYLYLSFLEFILPSFQDLNREMQNEKPQIHILYSRIKTLYQTILECYMKPGYLEKILIKNVQFRNPSNYLPLEKIYLGGKVMAKISSCSLDQKKLKTFRLDCLGFLVESATQIYRRFSLQKLVSIAALNFMNTEVIQGKTLSSIAHVYPHFPLIVKESDYNTIDQEWRQLRAHVNEEFDIQSLSVSECWQKISMLKKGDGSFLCPKLCNFVKKILILPHSSASVERVFSNVKLILTDRRNRLKTETIVHILHAKRAVNTCHQFIVTSEHRALYNKSMYNRHI